VITGSTASGEAIAGSIGAGASVGATGAAASGVRGDAVHATDAISAKRTTGRMVLYFSPPANSAILRPPAAARK
jgi:hypothetical protein